MTEWVEDGLSRTAESQVPKLGDVYQKFIRGRERLIASLGLAALAILGISGKPNIGGGLGLEVPNPATGRSAMIGLTFSSTEAPYPLGTPHVPGKGFNDLEAYTLSIGGAKLAVVVGDLEEGKYQVKSIGLYPGGERFTP